MNKNEYGTQSSSYKNQIIEKFNRDIKDILAQVLKDHNLLLGSIINANLDIYNKSMAEVVNIYHNRSHLSLSTLSFQTKGHPIIPKESLASHNFFSIVISF